MKRGEIWTGAAGSGYGGKPRPFVIIQEDRVGASKSITVCGLTTELASEPRLRPVVAPDGENGLREPSAIMVDKIVTFARERLDRRVGRLGPEDVRAFDLALLIFLGMLD
ncbi:MAG: mRNA interferase MazF [Sphingomonadales bacterium]|jgi:mRNA interferase MazF|nr:mRNA interferase MazF [Sphingomonadales bacterium]